MSKLKIKLNNTPDIIVNNTANKLPFIAHFTEITPFNMSTINRIINSLTSFIIKYHILISPTTPKSYILFKLN